MDLPASHACDRIESCTKLEAQPAERRDFLRGFLGCLASLGASGPLVACGGEAPAGNGTTETTPPTQSGSPPAPSGSPPAAAPTPPPPISPPGTTIVPVPPPSSARIDWGRGTETGQLVADVWTPGRGVDGKVSASSWEAVPKGRWIEIAETRIDQALTSEIVNAGLGWSSSSQLWGLSARANLFQSWSGFAVDQQAGRLFFLGGGHSDGYNNGLYAFDFNRMEWRVECLPSNRTLMSAEYLSNRSSTFNPESATIALTNFNSNNSNGTRIGTLIPSINGPFYDELPFDNKPTARHTYHSLVYAPQAGPAGSVFLGARRLWRYDLSERRWIWRRLINDQAKAQGASSAPNATGIGEIHAAEAAFAAFDEVRNHVLVSASGSSGSGAYTFSIEENSWARWSGSYALNFSHAAQARVGRTLVAFNPPTSNSSVRVGRYWVYDLDAQSVASGSVALSGGLTLADFPESGTFYDGSAMTYVGGLHRFWVVTRRSNGSMFWVELDPSTTPWTASPLTFSNDSPIEQRLPIGRVQWIEGLNAVLAWDHCFGNARVFRL
jgi:hypothetical protein